MNNGDYSKYNANYIDNIIKYLNPSDIDETKALEDKDISKKTKSWFENLGGKITTGLSRTKHKLEGGEWHDEAKAHQLVLDYINHPECTKKLQPQHAKIMAIYDRLSHLTKDNGTWADGLDKELLIAKEPKIQGPKRKHDVIPELEQLIHSDVMIPPAPEEQLFFSQEMPIQRNIEDAKAKSYKFQALANLSVPDNRLLFHIQADEFGNASELEGSQSKVAVDYLKTYLVGVKAASPGSSQPYSLEVIEELSQAIEIHNAKDFIENTRPKIQAAFETQKPLLMMGGWTGKPTGHAIYYEIIPDASGKTASLRLYNTGAGTDYHESAQAGHKIKYKAYTEWAGIDKEKLESSHFLRALYEIKSIQDIPNRPMPTGYGAADVYEALRIILKPKEVKAGSELNLHPEEFTTPQRAGVCSWKSLMAFLRTKVNVNDYKRFKCDIKLQSLKDFVQAQSHEVTLHDWRLVKKSHENLCQAIVRLHQSRMVGDEYLQSALEALKPIAEWVQQHAHIRSRQPLPAEAFTYQPAPMREELMKNPHTLPSSLNEISRTQKNNLPIAQPWSDVMTQVHAVALNDPGKIGESLSQLNAILDKAWIAREDIALHKGIVDAVLNLELDEPFWTKALENDPQKAEAIIVQLGKLANLFFKSCFTVPQAHVLFAAKVFTFHKILYLEHLLAAMGHPKSAETVFIIDNDIKYINHKVKANALFFSLPDAKKQQEFNTILNEPPGIQNKIKIGLDLYGQDDASGEFLCIERDTSDLIGFKFCFKDNKYSSFKTNFADYVRRTYPTVIEKFMQADNRFASLPKYSQDARIYASEFLPDWIKAMRDTQLAMFYNEQSYTVALPSLDRQADLIPEFKIEDKDRESIVRIHTKGVSRDILNIPEVQSILEQMARGEIMRYSHQYPDQISKTMKQFLLDLSPLRLSNTETRFSTERELLASVANRDKLPLTEEEFLELGRLFLKPELHYVELLEYFSKHPEKLKDPEYQILFHALLFRVVWFYNDDRVIEGILDIELQVQGFSKQLSTFIQNNIEQFLDENEIQAGVFLLKVAHQLKDFCPEETYYQNTEKTLQALLQRKGLEPETKCRVYSELIAELGHKTPLSQEEIITLLVGNIFIEEHQNQSQYREDPYTLKERQEALAMHASQIKAVLEKGGANQGLLNSVLSQLRGSGNFSWVQQSKEGEFPAFSTADGQHTLYPLQSKLISAGSAVMLPQKIRSNPLFRQLFPGVAEGNPLPGNIFAFKDAHGKDTLVHMEGDLLIIDQKIKKDSEEWFRYIPSSVFIKETSMKELQSYLGSRYVAQHYAHWQALTPNPDQSYTVYAADPKSGELRYRYTGKSQEPMGEANLMGTMIKINLRAANDKSLYLSLNEVYDLKDGTRLGKPSKLFQGFEDPAYIHEGYDDVGNLKKIELPRFSLSFHLDPKDLGKPLCDQYPEYRLNTTHPIKDLGMYPHYILLEHPNGHQKVLLPQYDFKASDKNEVLLPRFEVKKNLELEKLEPQRYLEFEVQKNGRLFSKSREANLYLVQVLGIAQEYPQAVDYLKKYGDKLSAYTPQETSLLFDISLFGEVTGDKSGNAAVIELYADYLRTKNKLSHHQALTDNDIRILKTHYHHYLTHYAHATVLKLKPQEEIFLLKTLLAEDFDPSFYLRLKALDPAAAMRLQVPISQRLTQETPSRTLKDFAIPEVFAEDMPSEKNMTSYSLSQLSNYMITRPQAYAAEKNYFLFFYDIARKGNPEEKQKLQASLPFMRHARGGSYEGMANFFETVMENPTAFPDPVTKYGYTRDTNQREAAINKWQKQLKDTAEEILAKKPFPVAKEDVELLHSDITPKGYRLDDMPSPVKPVDVQPILPPLKSIAEECLKANCFIPLSTVERSQDVQHKEQVIQDLTAGLQKFALEEDKKSLGPIPPASSNPVKKELSRLVKDLEEYQKQPVGKVTHTCDDKGLKEIKAILAKDKLYDAKKTEDLEKAILALANKKPQSPEALAKLQLQHWGGLKKVITLEELLIDYARQDYTHVQQRNPVLDEHDLNHLAEMIGGFLLYATRDQQRTRAEEELKKLDNLNVQTEPQKYNDTLNKLAQEMLTQRQFDPWKYPAYLVFEYFDNISIRPEQIKKLDKFLENKDLNLIMEMIMGSGKSKVLLPLLGLMRADGKALSLLVVPQPLFEDVSQDTQSRLQGAFAQTLRSLHFDRNTRFTADTLQSILDDLESVRKNKECLIMTSKSLQCLVLKFIGEYAQHFNTGHNRELSDELRIMQKILNLLKDSGHPIIDEADTVLNVLHEVSFSGGKRLSPETSEIELLSELYSLIYTDPLFKKLARLESDPAENSMAPVLTSELYFNAMQKPLAEACIVRLGKMAFESKALTDKMQALIANLNKADRMHLLHYLCRDKDHIETAQKFFDSLDEDVQDVVALAGEQISHLLPYTLTQICDVKYGVDEKAEGVLAIPFAAANIPNTGSLFANPHITMNYTFQSYMKKGIHKERIEQQIKRLQEKALREVAAGGGKMQIKDTQAAKTFARLKGHIDMPLFNYKPVNLNELVDAINANPHAKLAFVSQVILPQMEQFESKLSCNPHNLVELFNHPSGFTGTLWNGMSMHHKLQPEPAAGTDAKTLALLWEHSRTNAVSIRAGSTLDMLKQLQDQGIGYDMISDAGGYFKEGSNREIAHAIAGMHGKEVAFYSEHGKTLTHKTEDMPLDHSKKAAEERLTFLDQSHTTGADVVQKLDAISLVTIGRNMLLRDLLQAAWRLRGLDKSQKVRFLVTDEVAGIIRQKLQLNEDTPIQLEAILKFVIANQGKQQGLDNYKGLKEEFANLTQQIMLSALMSEKLTPKARSQAFYYLQSSWIKPACFSSKELYGKLSTEKDSFEVLKQDTQQCKAVLQDLFVKMPWLAQIGFTEKACLEEVDKIANHIQDNLPAKLKVPSKEIENDQTVEMEQEAQEETEKQTQTETEKETKTQLEEQKGAGSEGTKLTYVNSDTLKDYLSFGEVVEAVKKASSGGASGNVYNVRLNHCPTFPLKSYLAQDKVLNGYSSAFEGIRLSINMLQWHMNDEAKEKTSFTLLGPHRIDFHHLLVKGSEVTLMSQEEATKYRESPEYYNITMGFNDPGKKLTLDQQFKIVKLKFLNGESQYSKEEIDLLKQWFKVQGTDKMQKLFIDYILKGYPVKTNRYQDSPLQKLFAEF